MPINLLQLQEFYPCSMPGNIHVQQTYSLHEATSTYASHTLVSASLRAATPTERYLFAYRNYALLSTCNPLLTPFLIVFHRLLIQVTSGLTWIAIWVTGSSGSAVVTWFQCCTVHIIQYSSTVVLYYICHHTVQ